MQMWEIVTEDHGGEKEAPRIVTDGIFITGAIQASLAKLGSGNLGGVQSLQECEVADEDVIPQV